MSLNCLPRHELVEKVAPGVTHLAKAYWKVCCWVGVSVSRNARRHELVVKVAPTRPLRGAVVRFYYGEDSPWIFSLCTATTLHPLIIIGAWF